MANAQNFEIKLLGRSIPVKSTEGDTEFLQEVVELVSAKLDISEKKMRKGGKEPVPHQVTLLALLDLAEDYVRARHQVTDFQKQMLERSEKLIKSIEAELKE